MLQTPDLEADTMRFTIAITTLLTVLHVSAPLGAQEDLLLEHKLDNGLKILVLARDDIPLAYCRIAYMGGSSIDTKGLEGMTEFLRRLTFHGTHILGTSDVAQERRLRDRIAKTMQSRDAQLARFPKNIFEKLKDLPRRVRALEDRMKARLRSLATDSLPPMSRKDMEEILCMIRDEEARMDAMRDEIGKIQAGPHYQGFKSVQVLDTQLVKDQQKLAELLLPDPIRSSFTSGGALQLGSRTGKDSVLFSADLPANRVELFFWIESQRIRNTVFRNFAAEKSLALMVASDGARTPTLGAVYDRVTFPDHPYGHPVFGTPESVRAFELKNVQEHYRRTYTPDRAVIVIVGNVDPDRVFYLGERYFGSMKNPPREAEETKTPGPAGPCLLYSFQGFPSVELRYVLPGVGHPDWASIEWFAVHLRDTLGGPDTPMPDGTIVASDVELRRGRLAGLLILRGVPAPSVPPDHLAGLLKKAIRSVVSAEPTPEAFHRALQEWTISASERIGTPGGIADALAVGSALGSWKKIIPSGLAGLDLKSACKAVTRHLSSAEPVELLSEELR